MPKPTRSKKACDRCAQMKLKCDSHEPCSRCKRKSTVCKYTREGYLDPFCDFLVEQERPPTPIVDIQNCPSPSVPIVQTSQFVTSLDTFASNHQTQHSDWPHGKNLWSTQTSCDQFPPLVPASYQYAGTHDTGSFNMSGMSMDLNFEPMLNVSWDPGSMPLFMDTMCGLESSTDDYDNYGVTESTRSSANL